MKNTNLLLIVSMFICNSLSAQTQWKAHLYAYFIGANNQISIDTLTFGCDSLSRLGLDTNDIIDTSHQINRLYSFDSIVSSQNSSKCVFLKQDFRQFKLKRTTYNLFAYGKIVGLAWDTTEFKYLDAIYRISRIELTGNNCYLWAIDNYKYGIGSDIYSFVNGNYRYDGFYFLPDSIKVIQEFPISSCLANDSVVHIDLEIYMGKLNVSINEISKLIKYEIFPNPVTNQLLINTNTDGVQGFRYYLTNALGNIVQEGSLNDDKIIDLNSLYQGVYFLTIENNKSVIVYKKKLIKL